MDEESDEARPQYTLKRGVPLPVVATEGDFAHFANEDEAARHLIDTYGSRRHKDFDSQEVLAFIRSGMADPVLLCAFIEWGLVADIERLRRIRPGERLAADDFPVPYWLFDAVTMAMEQAEIEGVPYPDYIGKLIGPLVDLWDMLDMPEAISFYAPTFDLKTPLDIRTWTRMNAPSLERSYSFPEKVRPPRIYP